MIRLNINSFVLEPQDKHITPSQGSFLCFTGDVSDLNSSVLKALFKGYKEFSMITYNEDLTVSNVRSLKGQGSDILDIINPYTIQLCCNVNN